MGVGSRRFHIYTPTCHVPLIHASSFVVYSQTLSRPLPTPPSGTCSAACQNRMSPSILAFLRTCTATAHHNSNPPLPDFSKSPPNDVTPRDVRYWWCCRGSLRAGDVQPVRAISGHAGLARRPRRPGLWLDVAVSHEGRSSGRGDARAKGKGCTSRIQLAHTFKAPGLSCDTTGRNNNCKSKRFLALRAKIQPLSL
jgi:hypothetical protein